MKPIDLYNITAFVTPACSALFMLIMLGWDIVDTNTQHRQPKKCLLVFFFFLMLHETLPIFYNYTPGLYVYLNWLLYFVLLVTPVLCYRFVFEITRTRCDEQFSKMHYMLPMVIALLMIILTVVVPYEEQFLVLTLKRRFSIDEGFFGMVSNNKMPVKFLFELAYYIACFIRLRHYRECVADYASNEKSASLRWVDRYLLFIILMTTMTMLAILVSRNTFFSTPALTFPLFIMAFLQVNIAYHTLQGNYIILEAEPAISMAEEVVPETIEQPVVQKKSRLTKAYLEEYIHSRKPYLNPDVKITDLVDDLEMNRTYISGFINREYNMNFSRYINCCRLDEYHRLMVDPEMTGKTNDELAELAGFVSYRYFQRLESEHQAIQRRSLNTKGRRR